MPTAIGREKPKAGDTLYLIGFPERTNDRNRVGAPDSNGKAMFVNVGKAMNTRTWIEKSFISFGTRFRSFQANSLLATLILYIDGQDLRDFHSSTELKALALKMDVPYQTLMRRLIVEGLAKLRIA